MYISMPQAKELADGEILVQPWGCHIYPLQNSFVTKILQEEELNMGAKKFVEKCMTYIKTFTQYAVRDNRKCC